MTDITLDRYIILGTNAQRTAFTPDPGTAPAAEYLLPIWIESDTGFAYYWNEVSNAWVSWPGGSAVIADGTYGDITVSGTGTVWTIGNSKVTLAKIANQAAATILGNNTGGAGPPIALTAAQTKTLLGLTVGTDVQAYSARLADVAGITYNQGDLLYFNGTNIVDLAPGTSGQFLKTQGAGANPVWATAGGTGDLLAANNLSDVASAASSRTNLGLAIGTNVQAFSTNLTTYSGITPSSNVQTFLGAANYAAMKTQLSLTVGTDVQAYNAKLADIAGITYAQGDILYYNGTNLVKLAAGTNGYFLKTQGAGANPIWAVGGGGGDLLAANNLSDVASASTSRTNLGLAIGTNVQAYSANLTTYAGIAPSANVQTLLGAVDYAAFKTSLSLNNVDNTSDASKPVSTATQTALNLKADLASPALTGTPTAPTQTAGNNTTAIATTAFVTAAVAGGTAGVASFNTRTGVVTLTSGDVTGALTYTPTSVTGLTGTQSVAAFKTGLSLVSSDVGLGNVDNTSDANKPVSTATQTALNLKADLASPALTGNPTAPTQTAGNNSTRLATTAYVDTGLALKSNLASPTFTGTPAAPTQTPGDNTTAIATTAFVTAAVAGGVAGVASFNTRTGIVTLTSGDVTGALTYTPVDPASYGTGVATFLATPSSANLAAAVTGETGSGALVFATSPALVTPALGTPSSGTLTSCTGLPLTTGVTGTLPVGNGGTGITAFGTGVATALGVNVGSAGAFTTFNGALGTPSSGALTNCTADGTDAVGFRNIPQNSKSAAYTAVLADSGKHIFHPTADNNARTFTIPANSSVAYPIGTAITFINQINTVTIAITTDTLILAGAGTTGSRTLAANGMATAIKITSTSWMISGTGLT